MCAGVFLNAPSAATVSRIRIDRLWILAEHTAPVAEQTIITTSKGVDKVRIFLSIVFFLFSVSSHAFFVDVDPGDGTQAIGVRDLDILGTAYDVTFVFATGPHNTRQAGDIFTDEAGAMAAVIAIDAALNSVGTILSAGSTADNRFLVPYTFDTNPCGSQGDRGTCAWEGRLFGDGWNGSFKELDSTSSAVPIEFARCSPAAAVPVPAAAWLFGSALVLLGWIRKNNRPVHS